jgi:hypothetical protein
VTGYAQPRLERLYGRLSRSCLVNNDSGKLAHIHYRYASVVQDEDPFEAKGSVQFIRKAKEITAQFCGGPECNSAKAIELMLQSAQI